MNAIYANTPDGIIKLTVRFNPLWNKHQLYIDGSLYGEYKPNEEAQAIEEMYKSISEENIIKPNITLLISPENPLSNQLQAITGDSWNTSDFDELYLSQLIKHKKTGLIFRILNKREIKKELTNFEPK